MQELPMVKIESEEAKRLADIISIHQDLVFVIKATDRLARIVKEKSEDSEDNILIRSLWTAALIAYIRCFASGKRFGLSADIFSAENGRLESHQYFKDVRDKHIAHSVNPFEEAHIGIVLSEKLDVRGISSFSVFAIVDDSHNIELLGRLAKYAKQKIALQGKELETKILEQAKKLSKDELKILPPLRIQPQGGVDTAKKTRED